ncbi:Chromo domain-containing protein [Mycena kentingensis (nom. inval.)]|nr:Chromo domain-containing protein [Mycena kentingensis (nom. inval.)]
MSQTDDEMLSDYSDSEDVDSFLNTITLATTQSPESPHLSRKPQFVDHVVLAPKAEPSPARKWAWHGGIELQTTIGSIETISGMATVTEGTRADPPLASLATFLWRNNLRIEYLRKSEDVAAIRQLSQPQHQFAQLTAPGSECFDILSRYLALKDQVALIPATWDDAPDPLGHILLVPPASAVLDDIRVPHSFRRPDCLVVVLMWRLPLPHVTPKRHTPIVPFLSAQDWHNTLIIDRPFHVALRVLQIPAHIREIALEHGSVVYDGPGAGQRWKRVQRSSSVRTERAHLGAILDRSEVGELDADDMAARVVFLHVWDLKSVYELPLLVQRRASKARFCLYGTHYRVHPEWYGAREIFLRGGIVTFTASSLLYDLPAVLSIVTDCIKNKKGWACYLVPQVVALAARLAPTSRSEQSDNLTHWETLYQLIVDGAIALCSTPSPLRSMSAHPGSPWERNRPQSTNAVKEMLRTDTEETPGDDSDLDMEVEDDGGVRARRGSKRELTLEHAKNALYADMCRLQGTMAFATEYRRFVVLDKDAEVGGGAPELNAPPGSWHKRDGVGGIEWKPLRDTKLW